MCCGEHYGFWKSYSFGLKAWSKPELLMAMDSMCKERCLDWSKEGRLGLKQFTTVDRMCDIISTPHGEGLAICHINLSIFESIHDF